MLPYYTLDLGELIKDLGDHFDRYFLDQYTAACPNCGEQVNQTQCQCEVCGAEIIWRNSSAWQNLYGRPQDRERMLSIVAPTDNYAVHLCKMAGLQGFNNKTEAQRWARAIAKMPGQEVQRLLSVVGRKRQERPFRGRALMSYALNLFEKAASETRGPAPKPILEEVELRDDDELML